MIDPDELKDRKTECGRIIEMVAPKWYFNRKIEYHNGPIYRILEPDKALGGFIVWSESSFRKIEKVIINIAAENYQQYLFHELFHCAWNIRLSSHERSLLAKKCIFELEATENADFIREETSSKPEERAAYSFGVWAETKWFGELDQCPAVRQSAAVEQIFEEIYAGNVMSRSEPYGLSETVLTSCLIILLALYLSSYMF